MSEPLLTLKQINAVSNVLQGKHVLLPHEIEEVYRAILRTAPKKIQPSRVELDALAYECNAGSNVFHYVKFARRLLDKYT